MDSHRAPSNRSFGFALAILAFLAGLWPLLKGASPRLWALAAGIAISGVTAFVPKLLAFPTRIWAGLGDLLGRVTGAMVLAALFYFVITPVGLLLRLARHDPLRLRFNRETKTYWIKRDPPGPAAATMKKQF